MKISILAAGIVALASVASAGAATVISNQGSYTLTYDSDALGSPFTFSSGPGGPVGFGWALSDTFKVLSAGGLSESETFTLPSFTVTANFGHALSDLSGYLGKPTYVRVGGGAHTSLAVTGKAALDGGLPGVFGGDLDPVVTSSSLPTYETGYYEGSDTLQFGSFSSFVVSDFKLHLSATGGSFANIQATSDNLIKVSFLATPVPEPETYAMMLVGLGLIASIVRRRKQPAA